MQASGARSPLRALLGDAGQDAAIVHRDVLLEIVERDRRDAAAQRVDPRQHGGAHIVVVEVGADVGLDAAQDVVLHLLGHRRGDQPVHEAADAGRHAVDDPARVDELVQKLSRSGDPLPDFGRDLDPDVRIPGDRGEGVDGHAGAVRNHDADIGFRGDSAGGFDGRAGAVWGHDCSRAGYGNATYESMPAKTKNDFFFAVIMVNFERIF